MYNKLLNARKQIVFARCETDFQRNAADFLREANDMTANGQDKEAVNLVREIAIDLKSRLAAWSLKKCVAQDKIDSVVQDCCAFLKEKGATKDVDAVLAEAASIAGSMTVKACALSDAKKLGFFWGHDYCTGIDYSLRRGACFVTSNPAKINLYRKDNAAEWMSMLEQVRAEHPGIQPAEIVSRMYVKVVAMIAERLRPIYDASNGKYGFVCIQPNPKTTKDSKAMTDEVLFFQSEFEKLFNTKTPNIVYKVPAVPAALETVCRLKEKGLRLCITLNFSVFQHNVFSELLTGGDHGDFLVLMGGIVDDVVKNEMIRKGMDAKKAEEISHYAATAVLRRSYENLKSIKLDPIIMAGSVRGAWSILSCFTADSTRPVALTSMADMMALFDTQPRSFEDTVNQPMPAAVLDELRKSEIFRQAYEKNGLSFATLEAYPPLVKVSDSFVAAYEETLASISR